MKFKINNREWEIIEDDEEYIIMKLERAGEKDITMANGLTDFQHNVIFLNKDLHRDTKRQTLMHELMHCYIRSFIFLPQLDDITEETLCDVSSNSHDIIHEITESYFNKNKEVYE